MPRTLLRWRLTSLSKRKRDSTAAASLPEELLARYIALRDELERLGLEIQQLDREADDLLAAFSVAKWN